MLKDKEEKQAVDLPKDSSKNVPASRKTAEVKPKAAVTKTAKKLVEQADELELNVVFLSEEGDAADNGALPQKEEQVNTQKNILPALEMGEEDALPAKKSKEKKPSDKKEDSEKPKSKSEAMPQAQKQAKPATTSRMSPEFREKVWNPWLRPVTVLVVICLVASLLLGITNMITKPLIAANASALATATRKEILPQADGFENVTPTPLPANITAVYKATNDAGYVIEAYGKGYGGVVPAMVAFGADGKITGVKFLENEETPGLGKNLSTKPEFSHQFVGREAVNEITNESIDGLAGATLSTNAALTAVNAAVMYYYVKVQGGTLKYDIPEDVLQQLMPQAKTWEELDVRTAGVAGAYKGDDGTYVIVTQARGEKTVTVAVALDEEGTVLALWLDTSKETPGYGFGVTDNEAFKSQFIGETSTDGVEMIAGATRTSTAVKDAVDIALAALPLAKEAK